MQTIVRNLLLLVVVATVAVAACGFVRTRPVRQEPVADWEPVVFGEYSETSKGLDNFAKLARFSPLRDELKYPDDIEIRVWRGFGLGNLEMVALRFHDEKWSGIYAIADDHVNYTNVTTKPLPVPRGGWKWFGEQLDQLGIYELDSAYYESCRQSIDGISNLLELSRNGIYRTAWHPSRAKNCPPSAKSELIAEFIAISFDDGKSECKSAEWFPCGKVSRESRLAEEKEKK